MCSEEIAVFRDIVNGLNKLRLTGVACDGVIGTEDGARYSVHRSVMATCSTYFRTLFTTPLRGHGGGEGAVRTFVVVPGISGEVLGIIVDYAYTRTVKIDMDNAFQLLSSSDQFGIEDMLDDCCKFLVENLNCRNCIGIWYFSKQYFCRGLTESAWNYITENFRKICAVSEEVWNLPCQTLKEILTSDELIVADESEVWNCILCWINHAVRERCSLMPELLATVRLGLVPAEFFMEQIKPHPYVKDNSHCRPLILKAIKVKHGIADRQPNSTSFTYMMRARLPKSLLLCVGGWSSNGPTNIIEIYDHQLDFWFKSCHGEAMSNRAYHRCIVLGDVIYIIGGTDGHCCLNSCWTFNLKTKVWGYIAPMNSRRCYLCSVVKNGVIYAIGGFDGHNRLASVERYDASDNQWYLVQPMNFRRSDACACVLGDHILVAGGYSGVAYLSNVEIYDEPLDRWTVISDMLGKRSGMSCVAIDSRCYVFGGFNGGYRLPTCEIYDAKTNRWEPMIDMNRARSNFAAAILDGCIYVCGGFDGERTINEVERFNFESGEWELVSTLDIQRSALACCVVTNARDLAPKHRYGARKRVPQQKSRHKKANCRFYSLGRSL